METVSHSGQRKKTYIQKMNGENPGGKNIEDICVVGKKH